MQFQTRCVQIRALDRSAQNAEDGVSILESADGALSEIHSVLQRVRELCVQNANDTYTLEDRETAQKEVDQLMDEIDRISSTTEFNGRSLFDGSASRTMSSSVDGVKAVSVSMEATAGTYSFTVVSNATAASVSGIWNKITTPATKVIVHPEESHQMLPEMIIMLKLSMKTVQNRKMLEQMLR